MRLVNNWFILWLHYFLWELLLHLVVLEDGLNLLCIPQKQ